MTEPPGVTSASGAAGSAEFCTALGTAGRRRREGGRLFTSTVALERVQFSVAGSRDDASAGAEARRGDGLPSATGWHQLFRNARSQDRRPASSRGPTDARASWCCVTTKRASGSGLGGLIARPVGIVVADHSRCHRR